MANETQLHKQAKSLAREALAEIVTVLDGPLAIAQEERTNTVRYYNNDRNLQNHQNSVHTTLTKVKGQLQGLCGKLA